MKMKVVIFGPSKRFLSGISYYTIHLSNALSDYAEVNAVLFRKMLPKRLFPGWRRVGEELASVDFNSKVSVHEILDWNNPLSWIKAYKLAKDCDVMILQWWTSSVAHMYLAIELLNRKKTPIILEFHEVVDPLENAIMPIKIYSRLMGRLIRKFSTHFVVHSEMDKNQISRIYKIPEQKITVIPHGLFNHYRRDKNAKKLLGINEEFVILFFGLIRPYKGVKYLVEAFEKLPKDLIENSKLLIVGEIWEDREIIKKVEGSKLRDKITLVNKYVSDEEVSLYFSASDVLVLPYLRASQSGVAHIGMSFGIPIVATKVGGIQESLSEYDGTYFVEPNAESISEALLRIYHEPRKSFSAPEKLKWGNLAKKWIDLIEKI
ncbi:MAG: glycosyltransferase [Archaeoglobaceae archaeon]|nr:glycosyltransferase [Archaeoglobaceae archaeon]MDW8118026.1 glycosyltransferase [Archaeoglobaceae archaeon]